MPKSERKHKKQSVAEAQSIPLSAVETSHPLPQDEYNSLRLELNALLEQREGRVDEKWLDAHRETIKWIVQVLANDPTVTHIIADCRGNSIVTLITKEHTNFYGIPSDILLGKSSHFAFNTIFEAVHSGVRDLFVKTQEWLRETLIENEQVMEVCNGDIPISPKGKSYLGTWWKISIPQKKMKFPSGLSLRAASLKKEPLTEREYERIGKKGCQNITVGSSDGHIVTKKIDSIRNLAVFLTDFAPKRLTINENIWFFDRHWFSTLTKYQQIELTDYLQYHSETTHLVGFHPEDQGLESDPKLEGSNYLRFVGYREQFLDIFDISSDFAQKNILGRTLFVVPNLLERFVPKNHYVEYQCNQPKRWKQFVEGNPLPDIKLLFRKLIEGQSTFFLHTTHTEEVCFETGMRFGAASIKMLPIPQPAYEFLQKKCYRELQPASPRMKKCRVRLVTLNEIPDWQFSEEFLFGDGVEGSQQTRLSAEDLKRLVSLLRGNPAIKYLVSPVTAQETCIVACSQDFLDFCGRSADDCINDSSWFDAVIHDFWSLDEKYYADFWEREKLRAQLSSQGKIGDDLPSCDLPVNTMYKPEGAAYRGYYFLTCYQEQILNARDEQLCRYVEHHYYELEESKYWKLCERSFDEHQPSIVIIPYVVDDETKEKRVLTTERVEPIGDLKPVFPGTRIRSEETWKQGTERLLNELNVGISSLQKVGESFHETTQQHTSYYAAATTEANISGGGTKYGNLRLVSQDTILREGKITQTAKKAIEAIDENTSFTDRQRNERVRKVTTSPPPMSGTSALRYDSNRDVDSLGADPQLKVAPVVDSEVQEPKNRIQQAIPHLLAEDVPQVVKSLYSFHSLIVDAVVQRIKLDKLQAEVEQFTTVYPGDDATEEQKLPWRRDMFGLYEIWKRTKTATQQEHRVVQPRLQKLLKLEIPTDVTFVIIEPRSGIYYLRANWYVDIQNQRKAGKNIARCTVEGNLLFNKDL